MTYSHLTPLSRTEQPRESRLTMAVVGFAGVLAGIFIFGGLASLIAWVAERIVR